MISAEQNQENDKIVLKLVEENWGLMKSSFTTFKKAIEEKSFAKEYQDLGLDEYGRKIIKIEEDKMELFDTSYQMFKNEISRFGAGTFGISYKMFREKKIPVDKQKVKITNYLKEKIFEEYVSTGRDKNWASRVNIYYRRELPHFFSIDKRDEFIKNLINEKIDTIFTRIGSYRFPDKEIYFVISCNFADWLLCSTGETWSSCLSLTGGYGYWAGMPCMALDKNRAMVYLTDGKMKDYMGIKVPHLITRSWVLLFKNSKRETYFNLVGEYPNGGSSSLLTLLKSVAGEKVVEDVDDLETKQYRDIVSKYEFKLLYAKVKNIKVTSTIYLDGVGIVMSKKTKKGLPSFRYSTEGDNGVNVFPHEGKGYCGKDDEGLDTDIEEYTTSDASFKEIVGRKTKVFFAEIEDSGEEW